jgi:hypothetical protein
MPERSLGSGNTVELARSFPRIGWNEIRRRVTTMQARLDCMHGSIADAGRHPTGIGMMQSVHDVDPISVWLR